MPDLPTCFESRGAVAPGYHLIAPENRALSALPELPGAIVTKLVTPRRVPSAFAQYLVSLPAGGRTRVAAEGSVAIDTGFEHAFYGLAGNAVVRAGAAEHELGPGAFAFVPAGTQVVVSDGPGVGAAAGSSDGGTLGSEFLWFKRHYVPVAGAGAPPCVFGDQAALVEPEFQPGLWRTVLFGDGDPRFDFTLIRMRFAPGTDLAMTEIHDEEHGLWMTAGAGLYLLGGDVHPVASGDFIYMAPYCPQSFVADGEIGAEYLLYKDINRDGFAA